MEKRYPTGPVSGLLRQMAGLQRLREENRKRFETLTGREIEILTLIAGGMNNPAIAGELDISRVTVQNHRAHIREKLGVSDQTEFVKYALAFDLIQL